MYGAPSQALVEAQKESEPTIQEDKNEELNCQVILSTFRHSEAIVMETSGDFFFSLEKENGDSGRPVFI